MKSLFIDTSFADVSIAILEDKKVIDEINEFIPNEHSVYVVSYIDELLKRNNTSKKDIKKIYVVNGPGSFTGLRIGITVAKTYGYLNSFNLVPVSSLRQLAISANFKEKYILSLIDAKHDNYYIGLYDDTNEIVVPEQFINKIEVEKLINKYHPYIVSNEDIMIIDIKVNKMKLDISKIVAYYYNNHGYHPHELSVNYLKLPQALEEKND